MKKLSIVALALGLLTITACNNKKEEAKADTQKKETTKKTTSKKTEDKESFAKAEALIKSYGFNFLNMDHHKKEMGLVDFHDYYRLVLLSLSTFAFSNKSCN